MKLTFPHKAIAALLAEAEERWPLELRTTFGETTAEPGFWIVGDEGVYLMHNGKGNEGKQHVVYATECNPNTMEFDDWWNVKNTTFGGDDGVDFVLEADAMRRVVSARQSLVISFTRDQMSIASRPATKAETA